MPTFGKCETCKEYAYIPHTCAPAWLCQLEGGDADWWDTVRAPDAQAAATKYAEHYDCDGGDYAILAGSGLHPVVCRVKDADGTLL